MADFLPSLEYRSFSPPKNDWTAPSMSVSLWVTICLEISLSPEAFFQDRAFYPYLTGTTATEGVIFSGATTNFSGACIAKNSSGVSSIWLTDNLKGGVVPLDPTPNTKVKACGISRVFGYWPMENRGSANTAYALIANVETYQQANSANGGNISSGTLMSNAVSYASGVAKYFTPNTNVPTNTKDEDSVFFVING